MRFYIFKIIEVSPILNNGEFIDRFKVLEDAKDHARSLRDELPLNGTVSIQMIHASNRSNAEALLQDKYDNTVVLEWEN